MGKLAILAYVCVISCGGAAASGEVTLTPTSSATAPAPPPSAQPPTVACARLLEGTPICFEGGRGTSVQDAIVIKGAHGEADAAAAEYKYLDALYGARGQRYTVSVQSFLAAGGKPYDRLDIIVGGHPQSVYFDITDYFGFGKM